MSFLLYLLASERSERDTLRSVQLKIGDTLLLLLLTGTIFSYFCMSSITSILILAILIAIVLF